MSKKSCFTVDSSEIIVHLIERFGLTPEEYYELVNDGWTEKDFNDLLSKNS